MARVNGGKLTDQQQAFVDAYVGKARFNALRAARLVEIPKPEVEAYKLLKNPRVSDAIKRTLNARTMGAEGVLAQLSDIGSADWRDFVIEVKNNKGDIVGLKMDLSSQVKALELLGKAYKLFVDRTELTGKDGADLFKSPEWLTIQAMLVTITTERPELREAISAKLIEIEGHVSSRA